MKKYLASALLAVSAFASAQSYFNFFQIDGTNLVQLAGAVVEYVTRDVPYSTSAGTTVRVVAKASGEDLTDADLASVPAPTGFTKPTVPAQVQRLVSGGTLSVTQPSHTTGGVTYSGGTITGTVEDFLVQTAYLPQPPYRYGSYTDSSAVNSFFSATSTNTFSVIRGYGKFSETIGFSYNLTPGTHTLIGVNNTSSPSIGPSTTGWSTLTSYTGFYVQFSTSVSCGFQCSSRVSVIKALTGAQFSDCPAGYRPNTSNPQQCDLYDANLAQTSNGAVGDGKCPINQGVPSPFDKDCASLRSAGALTQETSTDNRPVTLVADPTAPTTKPVTAFIPRPPGKNGTADPGGLDVSQNTPNPDGSKNRQDISLDKTPEGKGKGSPVNNENVPNVPAPKYPTQPIVNNYNGNTNYNGTGGGSTCGGANQPACSMKPADGFWDGLKETLGIGDGDPELPDVTTDIPCEDCDSNQQKRDSFFGSVLDFNSFTLDIPNVSCRDMTASYDTSFSLFSEDFSVSFSPVCDLMDSQESIIRALFLLGWTLLAVFILISKVE